MLPLYIILNISILIFPYSISRIIFTIEVSVMMLLTRILSKSREVVRIIGRALNEDFVRLGPNEGLHAGAGNGKRNIRDENTQRPRMVSQFKTE